jgi:ribosomal protein L7/L12
MADQLTREETEAIASALAEGRKIEAIKIYREATGKGLKEAKDFIDALVPELKSKDPEKYAKLSAGKGCAPVIVLGLGVMGAWVMLMV